MRVGIEATNIVSGGGLQHLIEILNYFKINESQISQIYVWTNHNTIKELPKFNWLKIFESNLSSNYLSLKR